MSEKTICEYHVQFVEDIATIKSDLKYIKDKVCCHIHEGEKEGGFRDRLLIAEQQVSAIKSGYWKVGLSCGFVGALFGQLTPELWSLLIKLLGLK